MASVEVDSGRQEDMESYDDVTSPRIHVTSDPVSTDSMVTVRLSEANSHSSPVEEAENPSTEIDTTMEPFPEPRRVDSIDILHGNFAYEGFQATPFSNGDQEEDMSLGHHANSDDSSAIATVDSFQDAEHNPWRRPRSDSSSSSKSHDSGTVDWVELDKNEEEEMRDEVSDEVLYKPPAYAHFRSSLQTSQSTAFLLARLERENNALATDPRFPKGRPRKQSRPPSLHVLKKLVQDPSTTRSHRYSLLPNPPPMTELEFWAALVKDYPQTAQRLPTLTSNKIKGGVPPPLRGVVWMSMVGARDRDLADQFDKLVQESSPYENLIGKDIGRSFPGVEMFKQADGEGQQMLARVLKCFSLYDKEIGYCQGLGFLVGPLLMQMGDRDAFCILVKLMENYDLRSCFLPDLSGLHLRIYQFKSLLDQHMPALAAHLASLQVEAAYLSQWFLSFFAVTCPLPMLFRIYDVILAEGASETIMRVALSLMRRNEKKIMESNEFEEVMHLLLSRSLWESYNCNADDLVHDFGEMTGIVTRESLRNLDMSFKAVRAGDPGARLGLLPDATAAASRFLGRLWTASTPVKSTGLSPGQPAGRLSRPSSFLRRTPSKQSIAASINSTEISSEGTSASMGTSTTDATAISRESNYDGVSMRSKSESLHVHAPSAVSSKDKDLHGQIEDLLTALSEMQRQHSLLSAELQKEREEREEDHQVFDELVTCLKPKDEAADEDGDEIEDRRRTMPYPKSDQEALSSYEDRRKTLANPLVAAFNRPLSRPSLQDALQRVDQRIQLRQTKRQSRNSQLLETKERLRESLIRSRDQLQTESSRSATLSRQLDDQERETTQVRETLREVQSRLQEQLREKEKLEKTIQESRGRGSRSGSVVWSDTDRPSMPWRSDTGGSRLSFSSFNRRDSESGAGTPTSPLHELRLGRSDSLLGQASMNSQLLGVNVPLPKRGSSLATREVLATENHVPASEDDLLVELVTAKTSEAVARQELEEVKAKLDAMRKMLGVPDPVPMQNPASMHRPSPSESTLMGSLGGGNVASALSTAQSFFSSKPSIALNTNTSTNGGQLTPPVVTTPPATGPGGFWGWGKRSFSSAANAPTPAAVQAVRDQAHTLAQDQAQAQEG